MCSGWPYRSTDMQHDLFRSGHVLDLRSNFTNYFLRSNYSSFDVSLRAKYATVKMNAVPFLSQKLLQRNLFSKTLLFLEFLLSGGRTVDLRSKLRICWRKNVKRAIKCAFEGRCSSSGSRVMCRFVEKFWKRQNLTVGDLWWPDLWPN